MATMALPMPLPFTQVEESVEYVSLAVRVAQRRNAVRAWMCKLLLTLNVHEIVTLQEKLIEQLNDGCVSRFSSEELLDIASKIEALVSACNSSLAIAKEEDFPTWRSYMQTISEQVERLDSLAETFRDSASAQYMAYIGGLVEGASHSASHKAESWSDFVASLPD